MIENIFILIVLVFSIMLHEVAHGYMAYSLGDPTAKYENRLNFNPLNHIDPIGSILLPLFLFLSNAGIMFGWAKPVPINPYNFKDQKYGGAKVAAAGPLSNFAVALFFGLLIRLLILFPFYGADKISYLLGYIVLVNLSLMVFNLVPIPPLDGHHILFALLPPNAGEIKNFLVRYQYILLLAFIFFFSWILSPVIYFLFRIVTGAYFFH
ncbi:MAG TPA: site-2 protease family protein [Candidatus Pacearchaeota archaeon]|nr:site-2 protease family protein [Candidatus Pacearchaeota archaeon]